MNIFIKVNDRITNEELNLNILSVRSYGTRDEIDKEGNTHYLIYYFLFNGTPFKEEFDSESDRNNKLQELNSYKV